MLRHVSWTRLAENSESFSSSPLSFLQGPGVVRCTPLGYSSVVALLWVVEMVLQSFAILCSRVPRPRIGDCTGLYVIHWIGLKENVRQTGRCSRHPNELEKALVAHVTYFAKAAAVVGNAIREGPNENDACFFEFKFAGNSIYEIRRWRFKKCNWKWWSCTGFVSMGFAWLLHPVGIVVAYLSFNFDGFPCVFHKFSLILDGSPGGSSSSSHFSRGFWRRWPDVSTVGPGSPALSQRLGTNAGSGWTPWGAGGTTWGWVNVTNYILLSLIFILIKR